MRVAGSPRAAGFLRRARSRGLAVNGHAWLVAVRTAGWLAVSVRCSGWCTPREAASRAMIIELLFNILLEHLMPVEFDGRAHISLPLSDPRLGLLSVLRWELGNVENAVRGACAPTQRMLAQSDVRDKLGRLVQYACRMIVGLLSEMPPDVARREAAVILTKLMAAIGDARRCFRWLQGVSPILALCEASEARGEPRWADWTLAVGNKVALLGFLSLDHARWLRHHGVLQGPHRPTARRSMRWLTVAYACNLLLALSRAAQTAEARKRLRALCARVSPSSSLAEATGTGAAGSDDGGGEASCVTRANAWVGGGGGAIASAPAGGELRAHLREAAKQLMLVLQVTPPPPPATRPPIHPPTRSTTHPPTTRPPSLLPTSTAVALSSALAPPTAILTGQRHTCTRTHAQGRLPRIPAECTRLTHSPTGCTPQPAPADARRAGGLPGSRHFHVGPTGGRY